MRGYIRFDSKANVNSRMVKCREVPKGDMIYVIRSSHERGKKDGRTIFAGLRESQTSYARPKRMASSTFSSSFRGGTTSGGKPTVILQPSPGTSRKCS